MSVNNKNISDPTLLVRTTLSRSDSVRICMRSRAKSQLNRQLPPWELPMSDVKHVVFKFFFLLV